MEDSEIVALYWARDEAAIEETQRKYGPLCRSLAKSILQADEDAEECVNDALHHAWNAIPPQRPDRLGAWLGKVTRNLALNLWDKNRAQKRYGGIEALLDELADCVPAPGGVERELEGQELSAAIDRWLRALPREDRVLFLRRYWYGAELRAACLCAILLGTAGAVAYRAQIPRLEPNIDGKGRFDGYVVTGKLTTYPVSRFSDAFREAGEENPKGCVDREFDTFDEVRAYLGENIPCTWAQDWESGYTVMLYHDERQDIWGADVMGESPDGRAEIWLRILTKCYPNADEMGGLYGGGPDAMMERLDSYQMPNGCVAETFTIDRTAVEGWKYSTCISFFIKDGNMYEVSVDGELANPARLWPEVRAILDSFQ